jgi:phosphomannomutase/phosphoglucomutase
LATVPLISNFFCLTAKTAIDTIKYMKLNPYIFRNYDIRGLVPKDLDEKKVLAIARAYGTFLQRRKIRQAVVGHDCRLSGKKFHRAFIRGLCRTGIDVLDVGLVMTQMVYFSQYRFQANGAAMITASHNPANFNGFKLATGFSRTTITDEVNEIEKIVKNSEYFKPEKLGRVEKKEIEKYYYRDLLKRIKIKKRFKIAVDTRHGTAGKFAGQIFAKAGCEVIPLNFEVDGSFPKGTPDTTDEKLMKELGRAVVKVKADLGVMFDGDGDRIGITDEKGRILWNDVLVAVFSEEILERSPGAKVVYNTLCSQIVPRMIKKNGGQPVMWLVGHSFINKIAEEEAVFGGELSGHFFFNDNFYGYDDGAYAALRLLEYLAGKKISLSRLYDRMPKVISSPEIKIGCSDRAKKMVVKKLAGKLKKDFPKAEITDEETIPGNDGTRADFADGMIVIRYSQNGPYLTVRFEAGEKKVYNKRKEYLKKALKKHKEIRWNDKLGVNVDFLK